MKLIDKSGKLFGKVHIFDIVIALVFVTIILGALNKFSGGNLISFSGGTKEVDVVYWLETNEYRPEFLESIKVGDILAEDKKFLEGKIEEIEIIDFNVTEVDNNGNTVVGPHPFMKKARVKVSATLNYNEPLYDLGKQEVRVGAILFLTTEKAKLSVTVTDFKDVQ